MRREDFKSMLESFLKLPEARDPERVLEFVERHMRPPRCREDLAQGMIHVYYAGYTLNKWDEDVEKDEKVMEVVRLRERSREDIATRAAARRARRKEDE